MSPLRISILLTGPNK